MKYKNRVYLGEPDVTERELRRLNITETKSKTFRANQIIEKIAFDIMLWLKYYRKDNSSYKQLASNSFEEHFFSYNEKQDLIEKTKQVLTDKYKISIVSTDPLILSSVVPFKDIEENR